MHYAEKGSRRGGDPEVGTTTIELRMNYIDIPILLDVNLGDYQVGFGPYLGRMIKAEKWQRVSDTSSSLEDDLNTWDIGGQAYARAPLGESTFFQARISGSALSLKKDGPAMGGTPFRPARAQCRPPLRHRLEHSRQRLTTAIAKQPSPTTTTKNHRIR